MLQYFKANKPKVSLSLIAVFFISLILTSIFDNLNSVLVLYPSNLAEPWNWYRLLTYPLCVGSIVNWLHTSIVFILTGFIIEKRLQKKDIILYIFLSSIIGGLVFIIVNQNQPYNIGLASPIIITWGYWATALITGIRDWKNLIVFEKVIIALCILSFLGLFSEDIGLMLAQFSAVILISIMTLTKRQKRLTENNG